MFKLYNINRSFGGNCDHIKTRSNIPALAGVHSQHNTVVMIDVIKDEKISQTCNINRKQLNWESPELKPQANQ